MQRHVIDDKERNKTLCGISTKNQICKTVEEVQKLLACYNRSHPYGYCVECIRKIRRISESPKVLFL